MLKAGTTADLTRWLGAGMSARYESGRRTLAGTETDPAFISDLHLLLPARSTPSPRGPIDRLELSLRINNLFDASYATPGGVEHRQAAIAQDGRTVSAELRYRF
jgi:outer membrane receptor protein involved in Fe transport